MHERQFSVYILTNRYNTTLYTGVTNDLYNRVLQHKMGEGGWFTKRYNLSKLVYFETTSDIRVAILSEKQIKAGTRQKKIDLIMLINPDWKDLFDEL